MVHQTFTSLAAWNRRNRPYCGGSSLMKQNLETMCDSMIRGTDHYEATRYSGHCSGEVGDAHQNGRVSRRDIESVHIEACKTATWNKRQTDQAADLSTQESSVRTTHGQYNLMKRIQIRRQRSLSVRRRSYMALDWERGV